MLFYQGIITLSLQIITLTSLSFISCKDILDDFICKYNNFVEIEQFYTFITKYPIIILFIVLYIISMIGYNICRVMTNKEYTPTHRTIADAVSCFTVFIAWQIHYYLITKSILSVFLYPGIIGYFLGMFGILLYHEIIILYCCHFGDSTKVEIGKRGTKEVNKIKEDEEKYHMNNEISIPYVISEDINEIGGLNSQGDLL